MSDCTNETLREKLFAYELSLLDDEERQELELHLYECEACYHDLDQFADWAEYFREDKDIHDSVLSEGDQPKQQSRKTGIASLLITVAAVLILTIPAYFYWLQPPDIDIIQKITLVPSRSTRAGVVDLKLGGDVEIVFVAEEALPGHSYRVTISSRDETVVFQEVSSEFNESGQGLVVVPVDMFEAGFYLLSVTDPSATPTVTLVDYTFRVE
jgi:hypothetical protein